MDQIKRIEKMEKYLDEGNAIVKEFNEAFEKLKAHKMELKELFDYYGSAEWFSDFDARDEGKLPKDLKCGVLSEDLVYDLITECRDVSFEMLTTATDLLKSI